MQTTTDTRTAILVNEDDMGEAYYVHSSTPLEPNRITRDRASASRLTEAHAADIARLGAKVPGWPGFGWRRADA